MSSDREIELAWALADIVGSEVPVFDRHLLYITLGLGEVGAAIHLLLGYAVDKRIPLSIDIYLEARSWSQSYRGRPEEVALIALLDRAVVE
ncbi:hypothetical protein [Mycolicibacterium hippocampi]|uniref:hypothetical protein n=1 Tax=Mycolicibacterium hippocampi TaxID=659824 RepID=UPI003511ACD0